jgi:diaminopimelate epimerase
MIPFTKMQGIGNDFVMVDAIQNPIQNIDLVSLSQQVNDRRFGVGGDGLILVEPGSAAPFRMRMFNPDGSESEMCGNGIRCFAKLLVDHGHLQESSVNVETGAGVLNLELKSPDTVRVGMGVARLSRGEIPMVEPHDGRFISEPIGEGYLGTAVSMGNPHVVIFVPDASVIDLQTVGPVLEHSPLFPRRVNVHFVQVVDRGHLVQRTWERGAGITLACGTGACACAVAAVLNDYADRTVDIQLPGGHLQIEVKDDFRVFMTGPAETVFEGQWLN